MINTDLIEIPFDEIVQAGEVVGGHINMITQRVELEVKYGI